MLFVSLASSSIEIPFRDFKMIDGTRELLDKADWRLAQHFCRREGEHYGTGLVLSFRRIGGRVHEFTMRSIDHR